jgi:hypothetical protein
MSLSVVVVIVVGMMTQRKTYKHGRKHCKDIGLKECHEQFQQVDED